MKFKKKNKQQTKIKKTPPLNPINNNKENPNQNKQNNQTKPNNQNSKQTNKTKTDKPHTSGNQKPLWIKWILLQWL